MAHVTPFVVRLLPGPPPQPVQRPLGPGHVRRRLERRQLRPHRPGLHRRRHARRAAGSSSRSRSRASRCRRRCRAWDPAGRPGSRRTPSPSVGARRRSRACRTSGNRLDLDPAVATRTALPVVRVTHRVRENERAGPASWPSASAAGCARPAPSETWHAPKPIVEGRHCYGGTRMGDTPGDLRRRSLRVRRTRSPISACSAHRRSRRRVAITRR